MKCELTDQELDAYLAEKVIGMHMPAGWREYIGITPEYTRDLNAMREVEMGLDEDQQCDYVLLLFDVLIPESDKTYRMAYEESFMLATATPRHRAEAVYHVLEGEG